MTDINQEIDAAVPDIETDEGVEVADIDETTEEEESEEGQADNDSNQDGGEWPKKAVNALSRKNKLLNKTRAELQESNAKIKDLQAKIEAFNNQQNQEVKSVNPDDFNTMDDYIKAQMDSLVEQRLKQANSEMEKAQLTQEQQKLTEERDTYIAEQASEASKSIPDFTQTIQPHLQTLDSLPQQVADIFYSMENAPLAAYVLAKEGKLAQLQYANPYVAANEIISAHERGKTMLSKPRKVAVSNAPDPIRGSRGTAKTTKDLSKGSVLANLGLK